MAEPRSDTALKATALASGGNRGLPQTGRPYVWREAGARREAEVARILARIRAEAGGEADGGPGYEWYAGLAAEQADLAAPGPAAPTPTPFITLPALPAAVPSVPAVTVTTVMTVTPAPDAAPGRCQKCGYLTSAIGHKITCGGAS